MRLLAGLLLSFSLVVGGFARDVKSFNEGWLFKKGPFPTDQILFQ